MNFSGTISSDFMKLAKIPVSKRPSLVNFAATDFLTLRQSLIDYAKVVYPDDYKYFVESDLGMMFLELAAYMGAVMSMKADMLANENFLATAQQRSSVKKLLELIGISMKGPLSSAADAKVTFTLPTGDLVIDPTERVKTITSPEDGGSLSFTLYKVGENGLVDIVNSQGVIALPASEADDYDSVANTGSVWSNLAIQEGAYVSESGDFAATDGIKTIALTQGPVVEGSVGLYVDSPDEDTTGAYKQVPNIYYASGSSDKIFEVVYDDDYRATIVFGDGAAGVSPEDTASFRVEYRVGGGSRGNIGKDFINTTLVDRTKAKSGTLTNTSKATGGSNAETIDHAKKYAPLNFRRQDRLVTLEDYTVFSNTFISNFGTVGKAKAATRKAYASANVIDIYVLEKASDIQLQRATTNFKTQLLNAIAPKKMATDDVVIVDGLIRTLDLAVSLRIDKEEEENQDAIKNKVRDKLLRYMSADNRDFGEDVNVAELNRQIFEVEEVRYSSIDNLGQDVYLDFNEIAQLNNLTINVILID